MKTAVVNTLGEFMDLKEEWDDLAARARFPLLSHDWTAACVRAFHRPEQLSVIVVRDGGEAVAIAPMVTTRSGGKKRLELIGVSTLHEPSGFLVKNTDHAEDLLDRILSMKTSVYLQSMFDGKNLLPLLYRASRRKGFSMCPDRAGSPFAELKGDWAGFYASMSGRRRYDLRRAEKRAEGHGVVRFEAEAPGPRELDSLLNAAFAIEAAGWKGRSGTAAAAKPALKAFLTDYCALAQKGGHLRLCFLHIGHRPAAMQIALEYANRFWLLKIGYAENFSRCSPGNLLMSRSLQHAFQRNLESFEFLGSAESWLDTWATGTRANLAFLHYPYNISGCMNFISDVGISARRRFFPGVGRREAGRQ